VTLGFWPLFAWAAEFVLESSGAVLAARRRLTLLSLLLGWRAFADIMTFLIALRWGGNVYGVAFWAAQLVQYALLCALALQIVSKQVKEWRRLGPYLWPVLGLFCAIIGLAVYRAGGFAARFLDAEIAASGFLGVVIAVGFLSEKERVEWPWGGVAIGLIVAIAGNALCAILWKLWPSAASLYPVPALVSLSAWNIAAIRGSESARLSLPPKLPVQSQLYEFKQTKVM
jgi:hypothetical protein